MLPPAFNIFIACAKVSTSPPAIITLSTPFSFVIGEEAGKSKLEKAKQLGIEIITEQEFWDIINKEAGANLALLPD